MSAMIIRPGYGPDDRERADERERAAGHRRLLRDNLPLILRHKAVILARPEWFYSEPVGAYVSIAYLGGGALSIGVLLLLWDEGVWIEKCAECGGGRLHVVGSGGSPLSGSGQTWGICLDCFERGEHPDRWIVRDGHAFRHRVRELMARYANPMEVDTSGHETPPWSWSTPPEARPLPEPKRRVLEPVGFEVMIGELRALDVGERN